MEGQFEVDLVQSKVVRCVCLCSMLASYVRLQTCWPVRPVSAYTKWTTGKPNNPYSTTVDGSVRSLEGHMHRKGEAFNETIDYICSAWLREIAFVPDTTSSQPSRWCFEHERSENAPASNGRRILVFTNTLKRSENTYQPIGFALSTEELRRFSPSAWEVQRRTVLAMVPLVSSKILTSRIVQN